jgi:hypothetical protein
LFLLKKFIGDFIFVVSIARTGNGLRDQTDFEVHVTPPYLLLATDA